MNVTVLVTQFNDLRIERTLRSLAAQTRAPDAILVADGGSRAEVLDAMRRMVVPNVRIEAHPGSVAGTRASALRTLYGKTDVVAFLDTDQVAPTGWLAALVAPIEEGRADVTGGPTQPLGAPTTDGERYLNDFEAWFYPNVVARDMTKLPMGNSAWRVATLERAGGFDERLRWGGEDYDINLRVAKLGGRAVYVPAAWVHHDQSGRNDLRSILKRKYRYNVGAALAYMKNGVLRERMGASTGARFRHPWERWNVVIQPLALARALTLRAHPMRITLVGAGMIAIPPPNYGAVEKHIWNLAQALERRGHEVRIVNRVFGDDSKDEYRFALWARKEVKRAPYDVLHLHTPGVATIFQATGPRDWVYTTHSRHWSGARGAGEKLGFWLERRAVAAAREVIAVSRFVAEQIPRATHVVPNGVDTERYAPRSASREGRVVVGLGEVAEHKQWHVAAAAVRDLDATLRIAGPIRDIAYAKRVEELGGGKTTLLGALDESELARELGEADVMAHPSVSESFGMAVVEGMSAGLPVVASDMLSFLVKHGETGYLIPTKASDEERIRRMSEKLAALLADASVRARMGKAARDAAVAGFSWDSVAARVEAVYQKAVKPA